MGAMYIETPYKIWRIQRLAYAFIYSIIGLDHFLILTFYSSKMWLFGFA